MKIVVIIQARMSSSRLPGKVLLPLPYGGNETVLEQVIKRVQKVNGINDVIVATTVSEADAPIVNLCRKKGIKYYRGSEVNVLSRYYKAAKEANADHVIRITSDCPCLDANVLSRLIQTHLNEKNDYTTNALVRYDPHGLDCEIIRFSVLEEAYENATEDFEREHVTPYIYKIHPESFKIGHLTSEVDAHNIRVTLDTKEDYILLCQVYDELYERNPCFGRKELLDLFTKKPWLYEINTHIEQKKVCKSLEEELDVVMDFVNRQDLLRIKAWLENHK